MFLKFLTLFNDTVSIRKRLHDGVVFTKFDCNSNFIHDYILHDVIVHLRNQENCNPYRIYLIHNEIVNSLIEQ